MTVPSCSEKPRKRTRKKKLLGVQTISAAKKISMDAAIASVLSEPVDILKLKEEKKNGIQDFSQWTTYFHFTSDWL